MSEETTHRCLEVVATDEKKALARTSIQIIMFNH